MLQSFFIEYLQLHKKEDILNIFYSKCEEKESRIYNILPFKNIL